MTSEDDKWTWKVAPQAADQFAGLDHHVQDRIVSKLDE
jgi:mRNA interferase RelE/StbE